MWGLFIGLPLGVLQVYLTVKFTEIITKGKKSNKTILFILADIVLLVGVFFLMGSISSAHLIWTVSGMVGMMIILSIIIYFLKIRKSGDKA